MKKKLFAILLTLAMIVAFAACGAKSFDGASYNSSAASAPSAAETGGYWDGAAADVTTDAAERNTTAASPIPTDVKMIYRASLELESTEFGKAEQDIATLVEQVGGYFENRSVRDYSSGYHYAEYTVRVPAEKFHGFLNQIGDLCHVTYKTDSAENITERYYDTVAHLGELSPDIIGHFDLVTKFNEGNPPAHRADQARAAAEPAGESGEHGGHHHH